MEPRKVYFLQETVRDTDGGYIPCIAVEGEKGYYRTDWNWGTDKDLAQKICDEKNANLGITPREAILVVLGTM